MGREEVGVFAKEKEHAEEGSPLTVLTSLTLRSSRRQISAGETFIITAKTNLTGNKIKIKKFPDV